MMEWHLGKNASISVVKERHACVHALPFPFPFPSLSPLIESTETETETESPYLRIRLASYIRFINVGSAITCFNLFWRPKNRLSFPFFKNT